MSTTELKDWRGTPIEVGSRVFYNYDWRRGYGTVSAIEAPPGNGWWYNHLLTIEWIEHSSHSNKKSRPIRATNVTVLTKDMISD